MCAVMEALMGRAYLYVMVGRLVGMQVSQALAPSAPTTDPDGAATASSQGHPGRKEEG